MIASGLLFAAMGVMVKIVSKSLPNEMVVFFRGAFGLLALLPWIWHRAHNLKTRHVRSHLLRGLAGLGAMYCFFYAIGHMPLAEAMLLNYSAPLFVPFIALAWLGEAIPAKLGWALGIGFVGVLLILEPGIGIVTPAALIGLASGILAAIAMTGVRQLTRIEPTTRIVFYFSLIATVIAAVPLAWTWRTPTAPVWGWLILIGLTASMAQLLMTRAYAHAPAAQVGPFTYATVLFAAIADWLLWGVLIDASAVAGAALVCLGGALTIRLAGKRAAPLPELPTPAP